MNEEAKMAVLAIGALAEMCGHLKQQLMKNGFNEKQALDLVGKYLTATVTPNKIKEEQ
jgi:hypothetical protein